MLRVLPSMQPHFDYVSRTGGPVPGTGPIDAKRWSRLWVELSARYERELRGLGANRPSPPAAASVYFQHGREPTFDVEPQVSS